MTKLLWLIIICVFFSLPTKADTVFNDGGIHNIDYTIDNNVDVLNLASVVWF